MFGKVVKNTVAGQVIEQIKNLLGNGDLRPGDKLPPERQLADLLGVSRPSLREALRALEYAGVLETRVGEGVFVGTGENILDNNIQMAHLLKQYALEEMIEGRKVIECATVRFAAERGTAEDFEAVARVHEESADYLDDRNRFVQADYAFHHAISEASGNSLFTSVLQTMRSMMSHFNIQLLDTRKGRLVVFKHHEDVLKALLARDADEAVRLMAMHLDNVVHSMRERTQHERRSADPADKAKALAVGV